MRTPLPVLLLAAVAACGRDGVTLRGTFDAGERFDSASAWVVGGGEPVPVRDRAFELRDVPAGPLELRLRLDGARELRLALDTLSAGDEVELRRIWADDASGLAFPATVEGVRMLQVNGLRYAPSGRLPRVVDTPVRVLAAGDDGTALLVRPADERLPDLRVAITPGTVVLSSEGDSVDAEGIATGDSLRLHGELRAGVVVARRVVLPR